MKFQINIYGSPWQTNASSDAIDFADQLLKNGHTLSRCFFFMEGVYCGLKSQSPSSDEIDLLGRWQQLAKQDVSLLICVAAAANRGVLNTEEAARYENISTLADGFDVVGLGQWAAGFTDSDKIVSFK